MEKAPYDEKNQADYAEMTGRIELALKKLREDSSIPATEVSLSQLAECSRNTLRNRKYPIEQLKLIKKFRAEKIKGKSSRITKAHHLSVDVHIEENKALNYRLNQSRAEVAVWVNKFFSLEAEVKKLRRLNELLQKGKKKLESQLEEAQTRQFESHIQ